MTIQKRSVKKFYQTSGISGLAAPAWKTLEYYNFGAIRTLYNSLKDQDVKRAIAIRYNIKTPKVFNNYFNIIVTLRNLCAHFNVLFDEHLPFAVAKGPALNVNKKNKHKLYSYIKVVEYMLNQISKNRCNEMMKEIHDLFEEHKDYPVINEIIVNNIIGN